MTIDEPDLAVRRRQSRLVGISAGILAVVAILFVIALTRI